MLLAYFLLYKLLDLICLKSYLKVYCKVSFRGTQRRFPPTSIENTFEAIQSTCRCLEMHFKRSYKICVCSVVLVASHTGVFRGALLKTPAWEAIILGELESSKL